MTKKLKILLAEDSETNRMLMIDILDTAGLMCDVVENGKEAVDACINKDYDIVFMDCQMPVMDGYEAASKIRLIEKKGQNIIIIAITANAVGDDREKCMSFGMNDYISKPVSMKKIINLINKYGYTSYMYLNKGKVKSKSDIEDIIGSLVYELGISNQQAEELIKDFITVLPTQITVLMEKIEVNDYTSAKKQLHKIKGTAGNLRINYLFELIKNMEKEIMEIKKDSLNLYIHKINKYIELLKGEI